MVDDEMCPREANSVWIVNRKMIRAHFRNNFSFSIVGSSLRGHKLSVKLCRKGHRKIKVGFFKMFAIAVQGTFPELEVHYEDNISFCHVRL
jgi:hypothetical protein